MARKPHWRWIVGCGVLTSLAANIATRRVGVGQTDIRPPEEKPEEPEEKPEEKEPSRFDLLGRSFDEVHDVIKHMDDKIGRLLASVAFLTAATLALAALSAANFLSYDFQVAPFSLPMALISITAFLVGVFIAVMLLLTGLTAPIGVPGVTGDPASDSQSTLAEDESDSQSTLAEDKNDTESAESDLSQIWFLRIAEATQKEWEKEWDADVAAVRKHRKRNLVQETQNLARRAIFKHDRIREAVAILSVSLLAFAVAVVFVSAAASTCPASASCGPYKEIKLDTVHRYTLSMLFASYIFVQVGIPVRHAAQSITPAVGEEERKERSSLHWKTLYALSLALLVGTLLAHPGLPDEAWLALISVFAAASIALFPFSAFSAKKEDRRVQKSIGVVVLTLAAVIPAGYWGIDDNYAWQLACAVGVSGALLISSLLRPTFDLRKRQKRGDAVARQTVSCKSRPAASTQPRAGRHCARQGRQRGRCRAV